MNELNPTSKIVKRDVAQKSGRKAVAVSTGKSKGVDSADKVTLSQPYQADADITMENRPTNTEIRHDVVNKYRNFLGSGTYVIKADEIADKIVQKIRESKNHHLI